MPIPLLFSPAVVAAELTVLTYGLTKLAGARRGETVANIPREITPAQQRAFDVQERERRLELLEEAQEFTQEQERAKFQEGQILGRARFGLEESRLREESKFRAGDVAQRAREVTARIEEMRQVAALRLEEIRLQVEQRREEATERAVTSRAIAWQQGISDRFRSFSASLPPGFTPAINPIGQFISIAPGSLLTPADVAQGFEPLTVAPTQTRIQQIAPGVQRIFVA